VKKLYHPDEEEEMILPLMFDHILVELIEIQKDRRLYNCFKDDGIFDANGILSLSETEYSKMTYNDRTNMVILLQVKRTYLEMYSPHYVKLVNSLLKCHTIKELSY
jgi:hypothetical protein